MFRFRFIRQLYVLICKYKLNISCKLSSNVIFRNTKLIISCKLSSNIMFRNTKFNKIKKIINS